MIEVHENIASALGDRGFSIEPAYLAADEVRLLRDDFDGSRTRFKRAGIGREAEHHRNDDIRRDEILWFEPLDLNPAKNLLWSRLESLRLLLNERLYLGLWSLEGHYAHYPPGGFYKRHVDRFRSDDARTVSVVVYLNEAWQPGDGGELVLYEPKNGHAHTVEPRAGTLVCFLSDQIEHEVLSAHRERRSFAGWFRRRG